MKVAFACGSTNKTPFSEYIPLVQFLKAKGVDCFFILDEKHDHSIADNLAVNSIRYYVEESEGGRNVKKNQESAPLDSGDQLRFVWWKKLIPVQVRELLWSIVVFFEFPKLCLQNKVAVTSVFFEEQPDALVVYGDRTLGKVAFAIQWMKLKQRTVIDLQVATSSAEFLYKSYRQGVNFSGIHPLNFVFTLFLKNLGRTVCGKNVVFYPWYVTAWLLYFKVMPEKPWLCGASHADKYLMISEKHLLDHVNEGGESSNVEIVGQFSLDSLYAKYEMRSEQKSSLLAKYFSEIEGDCMLAIVALPQFFEHHIFDRKQADQEVRFIIACLTNNEAFKVLVSLHPKMLLNDYLYLEAEYPCVKLLREERLSETIPSGDLFISAFESTISWAILCQVKPIFLDYYGLGFDLSKFRSCSVFENKAAFNSDLDNVIENLNSAGPLMLEDRRELAPFDGMAGERIYSVIVTADGGVD